MTGQEQAGNWGDAVNTDTRRIAIAGYAALAVFAGAFGIWAVSAPLSGAAIASGVIAAAGNNQIVQHLEGGIIRQIHVREGDRVNAGDPLVTMDETRPRAALNAQMKRWIGLQARQARLQAQRDDRQSLSFAPDLVALAREHELDHVLEEQRAEFDARLARFLSEEIILQQRVATGTQAIAGFESQLAALEEQLAVVDDETERKSGLLDRGLTNRSEYTQLLRAQADLIGQIGGMVSRIEQTRAQIVEAREQLARQASSRTEQTLTELNEVSLGIGEVEETVAAARDVLERIVVRAPSDGLIVRVNQNTPGSVVGPGEELAQLLPTTPELIVEARLRPTDIDIVTPGQAVDLRFVALNQRTTPTVPGTVAFVSPDRLQDPATGQDYFVARVRITEDLPPEVNRDQIYPGMPVEALISAGERTFFAYLAQPITDSFARAFREQ